MTKAEIYKALREILNDFPLDRVKVQALADALEPKPKTRPTAEAKKAAADNTLSGWFAIINAGRNDDQADFGEVTSGENLVED